VLLARVVGDLINVLQTLIFVDAVVTNLIAFGARIRASNLPIVLLRRIVNPILNPIRRILPPARTGGWDLSPIIAILLLSVVQRIAYSYV
jgi:uncharacterized protein YggT (Ycf19 family)